VTGVTGKTEKLASLQPQLIAARRPSLQAVDLSAFRAKFNQPDFAVNVQSPTKSALSKHRRTAPATTQELAVLGRDLLEANVDPQAQRRVAFFARGTLDLKGRRPPGPKQAERRGVYDRTTRGYGLASRRHGYAGCFAFDLAIAGAVVIVNTVVLVQSNFGLGQSQYGHGAGVCSMAGR
jgi:hypothetical protein